VAQACKRVVAAHRWAGCLWLLLLGSSEHGTCSQPRMACQLVPARASSLPIHTHRSSRVPEPPLSSPARHSTRRLILSGTPLQNNVLELWSLFDFLLPGFLGAEREFNARYGKALQVGAQRPPRACVQKQMECTEAGV